MLIPGAAPEIAEQLRMVLGWAWTYVIVAELIGASSGIGHMITDSQALLATDQIIFGIILIGLIGLASDLLCKAAIRNALPLGATRTVNAMAQPFLQVRGVERRFDETPRCRPPTWTSPRTTSSPSRPQRLRQEHVAAHRRRARPPDRRRGDARGPCHPGPGADRGMVFQSYTLFPWLTVLDNVCFGLRERGCRASAAARDRARLPRQGRPEGFRQALSQAALRGHAAAHRIARALANDPRMLLMDEPFGALDHQTRELMQELLLGIWEAQRKTVLFVTHDIDEAVFMGSRVVVMSARPGASSSTAPSRCRTRGTIRSRRRRRSPR